MVKDIMENNFEYVDMQSLRRMIDKYAGIIKSQERTIEQLRARLDELSVPDVDVHSMIADLEQAQECLSNVYGTACDSGLTRVEDLMSCADSCIAEAIDALQNLN